MDERVLERQFNRIGARLVVGSHQWPVEAGGRDGRLSRQVRRPAFTLDIRDDRRGEYFWLSVGTGAHDRLEFVPLNIRPDLRHLLLLAYGPDVRTETHKTRFLCGHDERHWFAAVLPEDRGQVSTVGQAFETLKPAEVKASQVEQAVRRSDWNRRHNAGFIRQGEWFFVPAPAFEPEELGWVLHDEPLVAAGRTAHIAEWLYRTGGKLVYVCKAYPQGINEQTYRRVLQSNRDAKSWRWQTMRTNVQPYVMGKVRHPDHKTIVLPIWHRVHMSAESAAAGSRAGLVFLD